MYGKGGLEYKGKDENGEKGCKKGFEKGKDGKFVGRRAGAVAAPLDPAQGLLASRTPTKDLAETVLQDGKNMCFWIFRISRWRRVTYGNIKTTVPV